MKKLELLQAVLASPKQWQCVFVIIAITVTIMTIVVMVMIVVLEVFFGVSWQPCSILSGQDERSRLLRDRQARMGLFPLQGTLFGGSPLRIIIFGGLYEGPEIENDTRAADRMPAPASVAVGFRRKPCWSFVKLW